MSAKFAAFDTSKGTFEVELFNRDCPATVDNFVNLAESGFYDRTRFHDADGRARIFGGDPSSRVAEPGNSEPDSGGAVRTIPRETIGNRRKHVTGALAMANVGVDSDGSRFFIVLSGEECAHLDGKHTVFGELIDGAEILARLAVGDTIRSVRIRE